MSTYEKFGLIAVAALLFIMSVFSYHEIKEPPEHEGGTGGGPNFNESLGQDFKIGPFDSVVSENVSGGMEQHCEELQPVIIAALHDIKAHLEGENIPSLFRESRDVFEVNEATLQLFCNKNAEVTLADGNRNRLILQKTPFKRMIPPHGNVDDIGTEVRINASIISAGAVVPILPDISGSVLIPDRFLEADMATSSR